MFIIARLRVYKGWTEANTGTMFPITAEKLDA